MEKVSIITPMYQAQEYIQRYLNCIYNLDYKNIELILINDGSTDDTEKIINENLDKLNSIEFKYIPLKENKGQAYALNLGLKEATGDFISWHDVDDIYLPNCLSKCIEIYKANPKYKIIFSKSKMLQDGNFVRFMPRKKFVHKNLFKDYIIRKNIIFGPMRFVETKALFDVLENKSIFVSRGGQNWQMILPMVFNYDWYFIDKILSYCIVNLSSHSRISDKFAHDKEHKEILVNTLNSIKMTKLEKIYYSLLIEKRYFIRNIKKLRRDLWKKIFK